jgi:hypothetical protein
MIRIFLVICMIAGAFGGQAIACEFQDTGTQTSVFVNFNDIKSDLDVRICKGGTFMTGVQVEENRFLCDDSMGLMGSAYEQSDLEPNYALDRHVRYISHAMAACPPPTAMVGLNTSKNVLLCAPCPVLVAMQDLFVDTDTEREGMHACPEDSVMVGILPGNDLLLCARIR